MDHAPASCVLTREGWYSLSPSDALRSAGGVGEPAREPVTELPRRRRGLAAAVAALRPRQWLKNLLVFAGIVFAEQIDDPILWAKAIAAFAAYCAASSAAYLLNDLRDVAYDRAHPIKRKRPIARGELSPRAAIAMATSLAAGAILVAAGLGPGSLLLMLGFLLLQTGYTVLLKQLVLIDVLAIALLFVIRAAAGAEAVDVPISPWLLVCTFLLALFLALAKRRAELASGGVRPAPGRPVLERYSLGLVDQLIAVVAGSTIVSYALYTFLGRDSKAFMVTIPIVVFGLFRYLLLVQRRNGGEEPERVLLTDPPILAAVLAWALAAMIVPAVS
jgi:4-hydroxybenzoate polyprenyltransferase